MTPRKDPREHRAYQAVSVWCECYADPSDATKRPLHEIITQAIDWPVTYDDLLKARQCLRDNGFVECRRYRTSYVKGVDGRKKKTRIVSQWQYRGDYRPPERLDTATIRVRVYRWILDNPKNERFAVSDVAPRMLGIEKAGRREVMEVTAALKDVRFARHVHHSRATGFQRTWMQDPDCPEDGRLQLVRTALEEWGRSLEARPRP